MVYSGEKTVWRWEMRASCASGVPSQRTIYPGEDHTSVVSASFEDVEQWMDDRLAGLPPPSNCPATRKAVEFHRAFSAAPSAGRSWATSGPR